MKRGPRRLLTAAYIARIRELASAGVPQKVIAIDFGVSEATVSNVVNGARAYD